MTRTEIILQTAALERKRLIEDDGRILRPAVSRGRGIASSFWGSAWCRHVAEYSDYESRLPLGRSLLRAGGVVDLETGFGTVSGVCASDAVYHPRILVKPPELEELERVRALCSGRLGSLADFLEGRLSDAVIEILCDSEHGLFPRQDEIRFICDCFDDSLLCPHCAALLYGLGPCLDDSPELFFRLRGIDASAFFDSSHALEVLPEVSDTADLSELAEAFGIEFE